MSDGESTVSTANTATTSPMERFDMIDGVGGGGNGAVQLNTYADLIASPARTPCLKKEMAAVESANKWKRVAIISMLLSAVLIASTMAATTMAVHFYQQSVRCNGGEMAGEQVSNTSELAQQVLQWEDGQWTDVVEEATTESKIPDIAPSVTCPVYITENVTETSAETRILKGQIESIK
jgi:hypothetical protein